MVLNGKGDEGRNDNGGEENGKGLCEFQSLEGV